MNKPFIIKKQRQLTTVPQESDVYDPVQETRIQIIQAANGYLSINMFYESFKLVWEYFYYREQCADFAYLSLGFMVLNFIWGFTSIFGFRSINNKNSRHVTIFVYTLIFNLIMRIIMYIICGAIMKGYANKFFTIPSEERQSIICNAIYPKSLYIMQGIIEGVVCLFVLVISKGIASYIKSFEQWEINKHLPKTKGYYNLSDY